jgi:hypothetical protein
VPGVFAGDQIDFAQHAQRAVSDVLQIADWSSDDEERAGHGAILSSASENAKAPLVFRAGLSKKTVFIVDR